jgi:hypothetical protein
VDFSGEGINRRKSGNGAFNLFLRRLNYGGVDMTQSLAATTTIAIYVIVAIHLPQV